MASFADRLVTAGPAPDWTCGASGSATALDRATEAVCLGGDVCSVVRLDKGRSPVDLALTGWMPNDADQNGRRQEMAIITGAVSESGRLVVEEYQRRAQRMVVLGQDAPDRELDEATPGADLGEADDRYRRGSGCGLRREA